MLGARTGHVTVGGSSMVYNVFGRGTEHLVLIPGLGDGLRTVKGMALAMAWLFRAYAREHRVWVFSRKDVLEPGTTTRGMARDLAEAMHRLGITEARVMGVSQGGVIAQWLAIDAPERVGRLAIAVSLARTRPSKTWFGTGSGWQRKTGSVIWPSTRCSRPTPRRVSGDGGRSCGWSG